MIREATLSIKMPKNWMCSLAEKDGFSVKVLGCKPIKGSGGRGLVEITAPSMDMNRLKKFMEEQSGLCNVQFESREDGKFIGTVDNLKCSACSLLANSGCYLFSAKSMPNWRILWNVVSIDDKSIHSLIAHLEKAGLSVEVVKNVRISKKALLTTRQETVLALVFEFGYFEIPRKISLERLANKIGISKSTLDVIIRRAENKILVRYMHNGR
jgi:predicted DNA binding protein